MATNLYFLYRGGTPPAPYSKIATWNGRYLKFTSTVGNHGTVGGSSTHTHTTSSPTCANCASGSPFIIGGTDDAQLLIVHNHVVGTVSGLSANNDPTYYTCELIKVDLATWESTERRLPINAIVFSTSGDLGWNEVTRDTDFDGKMIKIDTAGSSGGNSTHSHSTSGSLNASGANAYAASNYFDEHPPGESVHTHTFAITSSTVSNKPTRITTRLYYATAATTKAIVGMGAFVDGTPSSNWTAIDWNGAYLEGVNGDAVSVSGINSHGHGTLSGTSSSLTHTQLNGENGAGATAAPNASHTHSVSYVLDSVSNEPLYVLLYPVYLNTTLNTGTVQCGACFF